jgi:hypothetical protein|tara:strand:+ start:1104 stop:1847 length:744 start_codon:yes stop_codon:yes gene_type:complete
MLLRNRPTDIPHSMVSYHDGSSIARRTADFRRQLNNPRLTTYAPFCEIDDEGLLPGDGFDGTVTAQRLWEEHGQTGIETSTIDWMRRAKRHLDAMHAQFGDFQFAMANLPATRGAVRRTTNFMRTMRNRVFACSLPLDDGRSVVDASGYLLSNMYISDETVADPSRWDEMLETVRWCAALLRPLGKTMVATVSPFTHASFNPVPEPLFTDHLTVVLEEYDHAALWTKARPWTETLDRPWYEKYRSMN